MRDVNNVTGGLLRDTLAGRIADRAARTAVQQIRALHRGVKVAEEVGQNTEVLFLEPQAVALDAEKEALQRREEELTRELEAIRERRSS